MKIRLVSLLTLGLMLALAVPAFGADAAKDKAREVFNQNKDSVIWVTGLAKTELSAGGQSQNVESKVQALGTIVDASGLTVVANSAIDPAVNYSGRMVQSPTGEKVKLSAKTTHSQVMLVMPDGKEVEAEIVLTDDVLDLAFVMPKDRTAKLGVKAVTMGKTPKVEVLDELVCLGRLPKGMDQAAVVASSEISGVVTKPRKFFMGGRSLGGPVFLTDGTFLGLTTTYKVNDPTGQPQATPVIVPVDDIAEAAKEALTKKPTATSQPAATTEPVERAGTEKDQPKAPADDVK